MADSQKPSEQKVDRDAMSGVETTGHEWDGIKELNIPAPRWWLLVYFVTIIWAIGYWVVYPAWPTLSGNTKGTAGWTQFKKLAEEQTEITARRGAFSEKIKTHSLNEIQRDPELYAFAVAGGKTMFKENCAACHGTGASGGRGYPNLNDDDWVWGGDLEAIYKTLKYGVRSGNPQARESQMPAFAEMLKKDEINKVADYVINLSSGKTDNKEGMAIFKQNCASCHGDNGKSGRAVGAPNLADNIWLYGSDKDSISSQIKKPRHGVMPAWETRLSDETIKQLSIYVHSLGGGESISPKE